MNRIAILILALVPLSAKADFIVPTVAGGYAWNRPAVTGTAASFQAWDVFSATTGPNAAQAVFGSGTGDPSAVTTGSVNTYKGFGGDSAATWSTISTGTPNAFDTNAATNGAFTTSGGNIYSPAGVVMPRIVIPNNADGILGNTTAGATTLLVQFRLQGADLDLNSVLLTDPVSGTQVSWTSNALLSSAPLGGFGGTLRDRLFVFTVPGNADTYTIDATAAGTSLSLDRIAVDTFWNPVPEPMFALIGGLALVVSTRGLARRASKGHG